MKKQQDLFKRVVSILLLIVMACVLLVQAGCGRRTASVSFSGELYLTSDTDDVPVGETQLVRFHIETGSDLGSETLNLECGGEQVAVFEKTEEGYVASVSVSSQERTEQIYRAKAGNTTSNEVMISFYRPVTEEETALMNSVLDPLDAICREYDLEEDLQAATQAVETALKEAEESGAVESYTPILNGFFICFSGGMTFGFLMQDEDSFWEGNSQPEQGDDLSSTQKELARHSGLLALIQPSRKDCRCKAMAKAAQYTKFSVTNMTEVSLDDMQRLGDYDIVLYEGHGGLATKGKKEPLSCISTSDTYATYSKKKYEKDLNTRIIPFGKTLEKATLFVSAYFFSKYYSRTDLNGTLIYFTSCHSMDDGKLAETLLWCGAEAVLGYEKTVSFSYGHDMALTVMESLGQGKNLADSVQTAYDKHGKKDPTGASWWNLILANGHYVPEKERAVLKWKGDGTYTLTCGTTAPKPTARGVPEYITDYLGMTLNQVAEIWGEDYEMQLDTWDMEDGAVVMRYKDDRFPCILATVMDWETYQQYTSGERNFTGEEHIGCLSISGDGPAYMIVKGLSNRDTYADLIKKYPDSRLYEDSIYGGTTCCISTDKYRINYVWDTGDYKSDVADYVICFSSPGRITEEDAVQIAKEYMGEDQDLYGYFVEDTYSFEGKLYYAVKISFAYDGHSSYAFHLFVEVNGDTVREGTWSGGAYHISD